VVAITFAEAGEYDAAIKLTTQDEELESVLVTKQMKANEA
jgi:hypothetical protein